MAQKPSGSFPAPSMQTLPEGGSPSMAPEWTSMRGPWGSNGPHNGTSPGHFTNWQAGNFNQLHGNPMMQALREFRGRGPINQDHLPETTPQTQEPAFAPPSLAPGSFEAQFSAPIAPQLSPRSLPPGGVIPTRPWPPHGAPRGSTIQPLPYAAPHSRALI